MLSGCASLNSEQNDVPTTVPTILRTPAPAPAQSPDYQLGTVPVTRATLPPAAPAPVAPARVQVDWAGVAADIEPIGTDATGQLELPSNPAEAGWYRYSASPDAAEGTTVLAAHVDAVGYGVGPFAHLVDAPKGTEITVTDTTGHATTYSIDTVSLVSKSQVPWKSVFTETGPHRLILVTCGGVFDYTTHHYLSNLLITAEPR